MYKIHIIQDHFCCEDFSCLHIYSNNHFLFAMESVDECLFSERYPLMSLLYI